MYVLFLNAILLFVIALIVFCLKKFREVCPPGENNVSMFLYSGIFTLFLYMGFLIFGENPLAAVVFCSLYFAATDWVMLNFALFAAKYTRLGSKWEPFRYAAVGVVALDTVSLLLNPVYEHVFHLEKIHFIGGIHFSTPIFGMGECLHIAVYYSFVAFSITILAKATVNAPPLYKLRHGAVLTCLITVISTNAISYLYYFPMDMSVILYGLLSVAVCYFATYYTPKRLIRYMQTSVTEEMDDMVFCYDLSGKCIYANKSAYEKFGISGGDAGFFDEYHRLWSEKNGNGDFQDFYAKENMTINEDDRHFLVQCKWMYDDNGIRIGFFYQLQDNTDEWNRQDFARYKATHDELTGLYNRIGFFEAVQNELKNNPNIGRYMICSNIKDFKLINELFGMECGDEIIKRKAEMIGEIAQDDTIVGRLIGERFAMLMPIERMSEEIFRKNVLKLQETVNSSMIKLDILIGVYKIEDVNENISDMCDKAMLAAHERPNGKGISFYDEEILRKNLYEKTVMRDFARAIANKEFIIYLQPQVDSQSGEILGAEALARWKHAEKGVLMPGDFVGIFEKNGYIHKMDVCIWEQAIKLLAEWQGSQNSALYISVNISAIDFYYIDIFKTFTALTEKYGINPSKLNLEITETALMSDAQQRFHVVSKLRDYGFKVEIDDFGSGYSSLKMLKDTDVDVLKIDMAFLKETGDKIKSKVILKSVVSLAKELNMSVVCEGVETVEQIEYLREIGCDIFQGFYFSKPISVEEFQKKYM